MGTLAKYSAESPLMLIDITYAGKRYRFNLYTELQVKELNLNKVIKSHASSYSFLTQLNNELIYQYELLEKNVERTYSKMYAEYKEKKSPTTGRPYSDDMCKAKVLASKAYKKVIVEMLTIKKHKGTLDRCVKAFETRAFLIQTLSANVRKEL